MRIMMIVKVTKTRGFTLSLENTFFEKQQGGVKLTPPAVLGLKISQNSWKNICARVSFLITLQASVYNFIKDPGTARFPVNIVKFLGSLFLQNTSERLLLKYIQTTSVYWKDLFFGECRSFLLLFCSSDINGV